MKLFNFALIILSFFVLPLFAGTSVGNGGGALVCRDTQGNITYAEMYDLYEYRNWNIDDTLEISTDDLITKVKFILEQTHTLFYEDFTSTYPIIQKKLNDAMSDKEKNLDGLSIVGDFKMLTVPKSCPSSKGGVPRYEQLVNYQDDDTLLVDQEIYNALSNTSKVSLLTHETIYYLLRKELGQKDSKNTRSLNAAIIAAATVPGFNIFDNLYCQALQIFISPANKYSTDVIFDKNGPLAGPFINILETVLKHPSQWLVGDNNKVDENQDLIKIIKEMSTIQLTLAGKNYGFKYNHVKTSSILHGSYCNYFHALFETSWYNRLDFERLYIKQFPILFSSLIKLILNNWPEFDPNLLTLNTTGEEFFAPEFSNYNSFTALMFAAFTNNFELAQMLLNDGRIDVNAKTNDGRSAFDYAKSKEMRKLLREYKAK